MKRQACACLLLIAVSCGPTTHRALPGFRPPKPTFSRGTASPGPAPTCIPPTPVPSSSGTTPALDPQSVTFVSVDHGWVWGPNPCAAQGGSQEGVLAETRDGGAHWSVVATPGIPFDFYDGPGASGVRFADDKTGYLFGHDSYVTRDGGTSWHRLTSAGRIVALETAARRTYALVAACTTPPGHECPEAELFSGGVAADRLTRVSKVPAVVVPSSLVLHEDAVFVSSPPMAAVGTGSLWASADGTHWTHHATPCIWGGADAESLAGWSSQGLAVVCGNQPSAGQQQKTAYESFDAGQHWIRRWSPDATGYVGSLAAASKSDFVLGEPRGGLVSSHDGGRTWRDSTLSGLSDQGFDGWGYVGFTDAIHGVAIPWTLNGSALAFTSDGGASWRLQFFPSGR